MKRKRKHSGIFGDESFKQELSEDQNCTLGDGEVNLNTVTTHK